MAEHNRYPALTFWSEEDEGYIAKAVDLPGCSAFGETPEEALAQLDDAIAAWVASQEAAGNPIPAPSTPGVEPAYSGKVLLRMPPQLHARIANCARDQSVSLNQFIVYLLADGCARYATTSAPHHLVARTFGSPLLKGVVRTVTFDDFAFVPSLYVIRTGAVAVPQTPRLTELPALVHRSTHPAQRSKAHA